MWPLTRYSLPAVIWGLIIAFLSLSPKGVLPKFSWGDLISPDKAGHLTFYAVFIFLILYGIYKNKGQQVINQSLFWKVLLFGAGYGLFMEIFQYLFFPGRYFEFQDEIANIIGSIIGILIFKYIFLKNK